VLLPRQKAKLQRQCGGGLHGIAEPGGICLSGAAFDQVRGKIDVAAQDRGS
jgi:hypothetical protein